MHFSAMLFGVIYFAVAQQQPADTADSVTLPGCTISLKEQVNVPAQEGGVIEEILVKEGQNVKKGEMLVQIDDDIPIQQVKTAEAKLIAAEVQAKNDIPRQYAAAAWETTKAELNTSKKANEKVPDTVPQVKINELMLACEEKRLSIIKAEMDTRVAVKQVDVQRAEKDAAQTALEHRKLRSSLDGLVREIHRHPGDWVQQGETVLQVVQMNVLRAKVRIKPEQFAPEEIIDRPVTVEVELARGRMAQFPGQIVFVDPVITSAGYEIRAEVKNREENGQWLLRPGMKAKMTIHFK